MHKCSKYQVSIFNTAARGEVQTPVMLMPTPTMLTMHDGQSMIVFGSLVDMWAVIIVIQINT